MNINNVFKQLADQLNNQTELTASFSGNEIKGRNNNYSLSVTIEKSLFQWKVNIILSYKITMPGDIMIRISNLSEKDELYIETGDKKFDNRCIIKSFDYVDAVSRLSQINREEILALFQKEYVEIFGSWMSCCPLNLDVNHLTDLIIRMMRVSTLLFGSTATLEERLIDNVENDSIQSFRIQNLKLLSQLELTKQIREYYSNKKGTASTEEKYWISVGLKSEGLSELLLLVLNCPINIANMIIRYTTLKYPEESITFEILQKGLSHSQKSVVRLAIDKLIKIQKIDLCLDYLLTLAEIYNDIDSEILFLELFNRYDYLKAYPWILSVVSTSLNDHVLELSIKILIKINKIESIEYIYQLLVKRVDKNIKLIAVAAIREIQKQIDSVQEGQLTILSEDEKGTLSLSDEEIFSNLSILEDEMSSE